MTVLTELNQIINLLESSIPANPRSLKNRRKERALQRDLAKLFDDMAEAFPYNRLGAIYSKYVRESLGSETDDIVAPLIRAFGSAERTMIEGHLTELYVDASAEMVTWGKTKGGIPIAYEGPPISQAIGWAEKHGAILVKGLDEETKKRLAHTISQGIENKRGIPGLARDIRREFEDMGRYRSQMIARTETTEALSQSSIDTMKDMGIDGKEWIWGGEVCDICEGNEAEGVVPIDHTFSSGHDKPPAHPNCVCAIAPAILR